MGKNDSPIDYVQKLFFQVAFLNIIKTLSADIANPLHCPAPLVHGCWRPNARTT